MQFPRCSVWPLLFGNGQMIESRRNLPKIPREGRPMERGILAPLSPNEELALRRIAGGRTRLSVRAGPDVVRLQKLKLVEEIDGKLRLTSLGQGRYAKLPDTSASQASDPTDDINAALIKSFDRARA